jgi:hypothetical protein
VLTADSGGVGEPELVANFPLSGSRYYLRVRERWVRGTYPIENISDRYSVRWDMLEPGPNDEIEINDSLELAGGIRAGEWRRGFIGWKGDVDTYCLDDDAVSVVARVDAVPGMDVVLRAVERPSSTSTKIDEGGVGEPEITPPIGRARAGETCFEVSADTTEGGVSSSADEPYVLRIELGGAL